MRPYRLGLENQQSDRGDVAVGARLILPDQQMVDEAFFRQLGEASCSQALVLVWDFNYPGTCRKGNAAEYRQSTRRQDFH